MILRYDVGLSGRPRGPCAEAAEGEHNRGEVGDYGVPDWQKPVNDVKRLGAFTVYCIRRFLSGEGPRTAAALSYTTLLALVPMFTIAFAIFSAFETFDGMKSDIQKELLETMLPEAAYAVSDYLSSFAANASKMTGPGLLGLAVTAVLLLNTITGALNTTWKVTEERPLALRVLVFWALLTLGPLLIGASISLSTYAYTAVQWSGLDDYSGPDLGLSRLLTFLLSATGFTLLFLVVPNRSVRVLHAVTGALVAALLFELLKRGFGLYITNFPTYQAIYGALAAIPIFLVWMYLSWTVLLLGAEIAASLPEWRAAEQRGKSPQKLGAKLSLALALLGRLKTGAKHGHVLKESQLFSRLPVTLDEFDDVMRALSKSGYVTRSGRSRWVLSRDLTHVTLNDLIRTLGLSFVSGTEWPDEVVHAMKAITEALSTEGERSVAEILEVPAEEEPALKITSLA